MSAAKRAQRDASDKILAKKENDTDESSDDGGGDDDELHPSKQLFELLAQELSDDSDPVALYVTFIQNGLDMRLDYRYVGTMLCRRRRRVYILSPISAHSVTRLPKVRRLPNRTTNWIGVIFRQRSSTFRSRKVTCNSAGPSLGLERVTPFTVETATARLKQFSTPQRVWLFSTEDMVQRFEFV